MIEPSVLVALLSLAGTLIGTLGGILVSSKLTNFRLEQLESSLCSLQLGTARAQQQRPATVKKIKPQREIRKTEIEAT